MFAETYSRKHVEKIYVTYGKEFELTLEMFLSGQIPKEEADVQIIIEAGDRNKKESKIDTTQNQLQ